MIILNFINKNWWKKFKEEIAQTILQIYLNQKMGNNFSFNLKIIEK